MRGLLSSLATFVLVGCAGADTQDVLADAPAGTTTSSPSSTTTAPTGTTTTPAPSASAPFSNCDPEKEPNDDADHANQVSGAICGTIASDADVDFLTFKLKGSTKHLSIKFDGKVTLKITVGTQTVTLGNGQNPDIPFSKSDRYVVEIHGIEKGATPTWRFEVVES